MPRLAGQISREAAGRGGLLGIKSVPRARQHNGGHSGDPRLASPGKQLHTNSFQGIFSMTLQEHLNVLQNHRRLAMARNGAGQTRYWIPNPGAKAKKITQE